LAWGVRPALGKLVEGVLPSAARVRERLNAKRAMSAGPVRLLPGFADRIGLEDRLMRAWRLDRGSEASAVADYRRLGHWVPLGANDGHRPATAVPCRGHDRNSTRGGDREERQAALRASAAHRVRSARRSARGRSGL